MLKKLRDELNTTATAMRSMVEKAKKEDRGFTADEDQEWNRLADAFDAKEKEIKRAEEIDSRLSGMDDVLKKYVRNADGTEVRLGPGANSGDNAALPKHENRVMIGGKWYGSPYAIGNAVRNDDAELTVAYDAWMRYGIGALTPEHRALIEKRAQSVGTPSAGGYTVPEGFSNNLAIAMLAYGGLRPEATVFQTATGNVLPWPTLNDTGTTGALLTENTADAEGALTFSEIQLDAYKYTSRIVLVSKELLQDSAFDIPALLVRIFGERLGRITAQHYVTGNNTGQPNGITNCTAGTTLTHKVVTSLTYDEMVALKHSVDPAYRQGAKFMFNDTTFRYVKALKDAENRPLWQPAIANAVPATLDGDQYVIDTYMPDFGSSTRPVIYGQLKNYLIRDVLGFDMVTLRERYAEYHQVGFIAIMRTDGEILNAGTGPIKRMTCAA